MKMSFVDELLEKLEEFRPNTAPKAEDLEKPDYNFYALAPYWLTHQAVCLLAGIATIDRETFETILSLNNLELKMNKFFMNISSKKKKETNSSGSISFRDFVIKNFPIPHIKKLNYLKNIYPEVNDAIKNGSLGSEKLADKFGIVPARALEWGENEDVSIPPELAKAMRDKPVIDQLYLPKKTFPDEININGRWTAMRIEHNLKQPRSSQSIGGRCGFFSSVSENRKGKEKISQEEESQKSTPSKTDKGENSSLLTEIGRKAYQVAQLERIKALQKAFKKNFPNESENKYSPLIMAYGKPKEEDFVKCNEKKQGPKRNPREHACRAIGLFLRHFDESISIPEMEVHPLMFECGYNNSTDNAVAHDIFRKWLNREGIKDRGRKKNIKNNTLR